MTTRKMAVAREAVRVLLEALSDLKIATEAFTFTTGNRLSIYMVAAASDPYDPDNWWKDGRQIRWLLAEYGAWIFYWWKELTGI